MSTATVVRTVEAIALLHVCRQLKPCDAEKMITKRKVDYAEWLSIWKANASKPLDLVCSYGGGRKRLLHHDRHLIMPLWSRAPSVVRALGDKPSGEGVGRLPEPGTAGVGELAAPY
jgi:hypothetical protein